MCERIGSPDLEYVATAVKVQSQTGGSLAGLFDTLSETVRERQRHARKVKALTALGRMSAIVLVSLPIALGALMTLLSPAYMAPLYTTSGGQMLIVACAVDGDRLPAPQANRLGEVLAMIILLVAGPRLPGTPRIPARPPAGDRGASAPRGTRSGSLRGGRRDGDAPAPGPRSELPARVSALLVRIHLKLWRKQSQDDVSAQLRRAGTSRRLTAELFMAGRVALMILGMLAGFTLADGGRRIVLGIVLAGAAGYLPGFLLSRAASRRAATIDAELPHFVDQLAIAIEAGMSFDAAVSHLADADEGRSRTSSTGS